VEGVREKKVRRKKKRRKKGQRKKGWRRVAFPSFLSSPPAFLPSFLSSGSVLSFLRFISFLSFLLCLLHSFLPSFLPWKSEA
jgi:hypothetical protein